MFNRTELSLVSSKYFKVLKIEERFVMIQSKNTKHVWMIFKKILDEEWPVVLYHKHHLTDQWFHEQEKVKTVARAVGVIKNMTSMCCNVEMVEKRARTALRRIKTDK